MSAWRQAAIDAFPGNKRDFLAMASVEEWWPFLLPQLQAAVKENNRAVLDQFISFAEWVLLPRPGSRPGNSLRSLTGPMVGFIAVHVGPTKLCRICDIVSYSIIASRKHN